MRRRTGLDLHDSGRRGRRRPSGDRDSRLCRGHVDPTPTGFGPADRLLAAIAVEPERSLDGWLDEKRIGLRDVAAANVASGRWAVRAATFGLRRRFTDLRAEETARDRARETDDDVAMLSPAAVCTVSA